VSIHGDSAIVIGGSVAGLMAAGVLSKHFDTVTIIEPDELIDGATARRGVPQMHHLHGLYSVGIARLDEIFGSFTETIRSRGASYYDPVLREGWFFAEGWTRRSPSRLRKVGASRWTIEDSIRALARAIPHVVFERGRAVGLVARNQRIVGVRVEHDSSGRTREFLGELVIDASGRGSRGPAWLEQLGFVPPEETIVEPFLGYATVHCELPEDAWPGDMRMVMASPFPGTSSRGACVVEEENGVVGFMAVGTARDYPPSAKDDFTEYLRTGRSPVVYEMWQHATPLTEIKATRTSANRLRHWNLIPERPMGYVPIGDAVAAFNPKYGQGTSVAAIQAAELGARLRHSDDLDEVNQQVIDDMMNACGFAWNTATGTDLASPATRVRGRPLPPADPTAAEFISRVRALTTTDPYVAHEYLRAMGEMRLDLLDTPELRRRVQRPAPAESGIRDMSRPPRWADPEPADPDGDLQPTVAYESC
jgi:2-polyprenyl-6-methoxyphenol hydroxylase-like FAD-dependent oxidoreductase